MGGFGWIPSPILEPGSVFHYRATKHITSEPETL
jgi:hypothetical protein